MRTATALAASLSGGVRMRSLSLALHALPSAAFWLALLAPVASAQRQVWIRQFGSNGQDEALAATPDGLGGVYMCGRTFGDLDGLHAGAGDAWVARYDRAGNPYWIRQFGTHTLDRAYAVAPDGSGGVFVGGGTQGSLAGPSAGGLDVWLARYDSLGNETWIRQFGSSTLEWAFAAVPDGSGGVYLSGATAGRFGGPHAGATDIWLARHDSAGNQTWIRQLGTSVVDNLFAAAPDGSGGVYLSGSTLGDLGGPSAGVQDVWLARFDGAGNQTWIRQFGTNRLDEAYTAAPDGVGGVYLSGTTLGVLGASSAGVQDVWLARFDAAGNQSWIRQFGTNRLDKAFGAAPDGAGGVFVGGATLGGFNGTNTGTNSRPHDIWLAQFDATGVQTWVEQIGTDYDDYMYAAAADESGGVFVCGSTYAGLSGLYQGYGDAWLARYDGDFSSTRYCTPANPNSTGHAGRMIATGNNELVANDLTLVADWLPQSSFGFFLTSRTQTHVVGPGGSQGDLCVGGLIGRFVGPGQILSSGTAGSISLAIDLTRMPQPAGSVAAQAGETWNFQAWHRDANPTPTSNFTDAVSVLFL
jgi:hypothetical protein